MPVRRLLTAMVVGSVLVAATPASSAEQPVVVGIGDQSPAMLDHPLFAPLGVGATRVVLPWDVALTDPARMDAWATGIRAAGVEGLVALGHSRGNACPEAPCVLPSEEAYRAAFLALRSRWPWLQQFTPWNEPNHRSEPTAGNPEAAAAFANTIARACPECTVVAGDLLDAPGMATWLETYKAALEFTPAAWGLHNYYDTNYFRSTGTKTFLAAVDGPVWITESGGIVTWQTRDGRVQMPYDERRAAASVQFAIELARESADRVRRLYVYQWRAGATDGFDAGLLRPTGEPRPGYDVLKSALVTQAEPESASPARPADRPATLAPAPPPAAAPPDRGRFRIASARRVGASSLRVRVRCGGAQCSGRLTLVGAGWATPVIENGRVIAGTLRSRSRSVTLAAGTVAGIRFRLPRAVSRRALARPLIVKVAAVPHEGPGAARAVLRVGPRLRGAPVRTR